jgi:FSR family fosmidomycin resistance protein-like MFS transporter
VERKSAWGVLGTYAVTHAVVDAACAVLLWTAYGDGRLSASAAWSAFFAYNLLAFAVQPLVGLALDGLRLGRGAAAGGALLTAAALPVALVPGAIWAAVVIAGLGNAVFHVGGGIVSLRAAPGRAAPVGVFVAPGAAGLAMGILAGKAGAPAWPWVAALAALAVAVALLPTPTLDATAGEHKHAQTPGWLAVAGMGVVTLLLVVVGVRSLVGFMLVMPWKSDLALLAALTAAVVAGKAAGGLLADRFGWRRVAVTALVASSPLLTLGAESPAAGIAGVLLFNMTMPVTLAAVAAVLPRGHEGFAFGLTCLALFCGSAPALLSLPLKSTPWLLAALILPVATALWFALGGWARRSRPDHVPLQPATDGGRS